MKHGRKRHEGNFPGRDPKGPEVALTWTTARDERDAVMERQRENGGPAGGLVRGWTSRRQRATRRGWLSEGD